MENKKNEKPIIFLVLKIIGFVLLGIGFVILVSSLTKHVPSMGSSGWFESTKSRSFGIFGGIVCLMFGVSILFMGFAPAIKKIMIKTSKYLINENKEDMKDIADAGADIASGAITKTVKSVKDGFKDEDTMFCKHCGKSIDADSKFCNKCGGEQ